MFFIPAVQITQQPSSEEWHIAISPGRLCVCVCVMSVCVYVCILIDEASRACAKINRRLICGLTIYFEFDNEASLFLSRK